MIKPSAIRRLLIQSNPLLARNPDTLHVYLEDGHIAARGASSLSFEYHYTLKLLVQDWPHHLDALMVPLLAWLRTAQPELFENLDKAKSPVRFEVDALSESTADILMQVDLTERVIVSPHPDATKGVRLKAVHVGEPPHPDYPQADVHIELWFENEHLGSFTAPAWAPFA